MKKLISLLLAFILLAGFFSVAALVPAQAATIPYGSVPILIGDPETDLMADRILSKINTAGLSDRAKIQKVYDWIIKNCVREKDGEDVPWLDGPSDAEVAAYSAEMLTKLENGQAVLRKELADIYTDYVYGEKDWSYNQAFLESNEIMCRYANTMMHSSLTGNCVHFSALFALLLGHLGYDARMITGAFINKSGPVAHTWNLVLVGSRYYWFDIRIDHSITNAQNQASPTHYYFMKDSTNQWEKTHIWARGYTDLLENNCAAIKSMYEKRENHEHQWYVDYSGTATCETIGLWSERCSVCGIRRVTQQALGHDWSVIDNHMPTCTSDGYRQLLCCRCFKTVREVIPATGHKWQVAQILTPGQDGGHGTANYRCTACGGVKTARLCAAEIFTDAPADGNWAHIPVDWSFLNGIANGTSRTSFSPDAVCTRAQFVTFLWRAAGSPIPASEDCPFTDVAKQDYYYHAVLWALENHITSGTSRSRFSPGRNCTREQVVTFLWRYAGQPMFEDNAFPFADVQTYRYSYPAIVWAVSEHITTGTGATTFRPEKSCTRAEGITFLYRLFTGQ